MFFHSHVFILGFLPLLIVLYAATGRFTHAVTVRKWLLIMASVAFYAGFGWRSMAVFALSVAGNYLVYLWMRKCVRGTGTVTHFSDDDCACSSPGEKCVTVPVPLTHFLKTTGVVLNIAVLAFFKYVGALEFGRTHGIVMPVALSFTTFTQIAFLVDGPVPLVTFSDYMLHILFFPKILQGPIQRFADTKEKILDHLQDGVHTEGLLRGLKLFTFGLAKKVLLADVLAASVSMGYENVIDLTRSDAVVVMLVYPLQLYLDFSGYCDMGRGIARMLSLDLIENFDRPYHAVSVTDYWSRWHKSMTAFFRRCVYIPLGGNRKGTARTCLNIMIVFLLSGLWHGTGWGFLIWGAMQGVAICVERITGDKRDRSKCHHEEQVTFEPVPFVTFLRRTVTYLYISISLVFFGAPSVTDALQMLTQPFRAIINYVSPAIAGTFYTDEVWYAVKALHLDGWRYGSYICMAVVIVLSVAVVAGDKRDGSECHHGEQVTFGPVPFVTHVCAGVLLAWCIISLSEVQTFLYVNF